MKKTVIITGASRGIGRNIAQNLAIQGYNVIVNYNKSEKEAINLKEELNIKGVEIDLFRADVSKVEEIQALIEYVKSKYNKIDVLINNAGISQVKLFTEILDEEWKKMMDVNLFSAFVMSREVVKEMIKQKEGCIINISSIWGITGGSCEVHYSASKAGIDGLTKALAKEVGPSNVRVNSIAPGAILTDMNKEITEQEWEELKQEIPLRKIGNPVDITRCVQWLIEDEYTTGQVISINGGLVI